MVIIWARQQQSRVSEGLSFREMMGIDLTCGALPAKDETCLGSDLLCQSETFQISDVAQWLKALNATSFLWREGVGSIPRLGETQKENWRWGKPTPQYLPRLRDRHLPNAPVNISGWKRGARQLTKKGSSDQVAIDKVSDHRALKHFLYEWSACHYYTSRRILWPYIDSTQKAGQLLLGPR